MPRVLTEEHKRKLALGREKALANRRAKAKAKRVQKELDALELKKMREDNAKKLAALKGKQEMPAVTPEKPVKPEPKVGEQKPEQPPVSDKPAKTVERAAQTQPSPNKLAVDNVAAPKQKKKKRKKRVVVLESDSESDDEEIVVVRAPRRRRRAPSPHPRPRSQPVPIPQPKPLPKPRQPSRQELEARARKRRQDFLTSVMGDRWR